MTLSPPPGKGEELELRYGAQGPAASRLEERGGIREKLGLWAGKREWWARGREAGKMSCRS